MRLFEFDNATVSIMGLLTHLKRKAKGYKAASVNTQSFLNMLLNVGVKVDTEGLEKIKNENPAIGNLIKSIDDDKVHLNISGKPQDNFDDMGDDFDDLGMDDDMMNNPNQNQPMGQMGPTTNDFQNQQQGIAGGPGGAVNTVPTMAKRALSRRQ